MAPEKWEHVRRILAIRLDNIGDAIMLGPALRTVAAALPQAQVTLMASPAGSQVAPLLPWIHDVMVQRVSWQDISGTWPQDSQIELALVEQIRARHFDAALIFTSFSQSPYPPAYVCYLAGVPLRLGQSKEFGGALLSQWVRPLPDEAHQVDRNLHLLECAGFTPAGRHLELNVPGAAQHEADCRLRELGLDPLRPFIVLAPGASAAARRYDARRYAQVARLLAQKSGVPMVVIGSSRERELTQPIVEAAPRGMIFSLVGQTSVPELAGVIRRSALVIANDSGPMHFADAFGRPMVILFAGTEHESQWQPRSAPARLLRRPTDCSPCYAFRCPFHMECLDIPAEEVVAEAMEMLKQ